MRFSGIGTRLKRRFSVGKKNGGVALLKKKNTIDIDRRTVRTVKNSEKYSIRLDVAKRVLSLSPSF